MLVAINNAWAQQIANNRLYKMQFLIVGLDQIMTARMLGVRRLVLIVMTWFVGLVCRHVLLVISKLSVRLVQVTPVPPVLTEELLLLTIVAVVTIQPALNAMALAPVTRNRVPRAVTEGLRTRVPVVNLSQELLVLVEVLQVQHTKYGQLENVATVLVKAKLPRKQRARQVQQLFLGRIRPQIL
jgi:hypothetical protein